MNKVENNIEVNEWVRQAENIGLDEKDRVFSIVERASHIKSESEKFKADIENTSMEGFDMDYEEVLEDLQDSLIALCAVADKVDAERLKE